MSKRLTILLSLLGIVLAAAVGMLIPTAADRARQQAALNQWLADSAAYEGILNKWLRDSIVIDSIAQTIPTDSLRRLYRAAKDARYPSAHISSDRV